MGWRWKKNDNPKNPPARPEYRRYEMYELTSDDVVIMFVSKFKSDFNLMNDIRNKKITQERFIQKLNSDFGLNLNICDNIYYRLNTLSNLIK